MFHLLPNVLVPITVFTKPLSNFYPSVISLSSAVTPDTFNQRWSFHPCFPKWSWTRYGLLLKTELILYNVSSYSSSRQHCSIRCNYANNLLLNCCCKAGEGRTKAWVFTGQRQIPSLSHVSHKTYTADMHLPHTSCCSHSTSEKGKVRLKALWHWKSWWRICVSFPSKELSVHKDTAIIQLSTVLFSSVPLSSFPGSQPASSAKRRRAKGISAVPFQLLSSSFSLFLKKK